MLERVLSCYNISPEAHIQPYGSGLINNTWIIEAGSKEYILQKINHDIFKEPQLIADNIDTISNFIKREQPKYFFVSPINTMEDKPMLFLENEGYFRIFPFIKNSHTNDVAETPQQAFEAAKQFGLFTKILKSFPAASLKTTLPNFHNLSLRYEMFLAACLGGNAVRIKEARKEIEFIQHHQYIVNTYKEIVNSPDFKLRVIHHDTKISNVLFDDIDKGICVIDLDTVMPGYFISDVGDMMRTYLSPVSEECKDFSSIVIRDEYFKAILEGYMSEMADELSSSELDKFFYSGLFMIYMQAVRFLTDHLNNDIYYGAKYEGQNYLRAKNQIDLLKKLLAKEALFNDLVFQARHEISSYHKPE